MKVVEDDTPAVSGQRQDARARSSVDLPLWLLAVVTAMCQSVGERSVVYLSAAGSSGSSSGSLYDVYGRFPHPFPSVIFNVGHCKGGGAGTAPAPGLFLFGLIAVYASSNRNSAHFDSPANPPTRYSSTFIRVLAFF